MAKRNTFIEAQEAYRQAVSDLDRKKPQREVYKLFTDNGCEVGRLVYEPQDDSITIHLPGVETKIPGDGLRSLYSALGDLVG